MRKPDKTKIIAVILFYGILSSSFVLIPTAVATWYTDYRDPNLENVVLAAEEYCAETFEEEMTVVTYDREPFSGYQIVFSPVKDEDLMFTVTISPILKRIQDDYYEQTIRQSIEDELAGEITPYYPDARVLLFTHDSRFSAAVQKLEEEANVTEEQLREAIDGTFLILVSNSPPLDSTNYEGGLDDLCQVIQAVRQYKYQPYELDVWPEGSWDTEDYYAGHLPLLLFEFTPGDYGQIDSPGDLIPFVHPH